MTSITTLPLTHISSYLNRQERLSFASTCRSVHTSIISTLSAEFDKELAYQSFRLCHLKPKKPKNSKNSKKSQKSENKPTSLTSLNSASYLQLDYPIFSLPSQVKSLQFTFESSSNGTSIFANKFGDKLLIHSSLVEVPSVPESKSFEFLADAQELNEDIDFSNPMMLARRQKNLLEKVKKFHEERFELQKKAAMKHVRNWGETVIILCHGGNFNIACFKHNGQLEKSNSDHKYVSRKAQGGRQSTADKQGGGIHSKGASIRRENEKKHSENIESIVNANQEVLNRASLIFLHAPGMNYFTFIGESGLLKKWKDKVRSVGVTTGKAKLQEAERVFAEITMSTLLIRV